MKTNLMSRLDIALVLVGTICTQLDATEIAELFEALTGITITPAGSHPELANYWKCDVSFEEMSDDTLPTLLDYLKSKLPQ